MAAPRGQASAPRGQASAPREQRKAGAMALRPRRLGDRLWGTPEAGGTPSAPLTSVLGAHQARRRALPRWSLTRRHLAEALACP